MSSSSSVDSSHTAEHSRLYSPYSWSGGANSYITFDLGTNKQLQGIAMQGDGSVAKYVTVYKLECGYKSDQIEQVKVR